MPTIKGPFKISGGFDARKFLEDKLGEVKVKLPFEATGWKSKKNSNLVPGAVEEKPKKEKKKVKKVKKK